MSISSRVSDDGLAARAHQTLVPTGERGRRSKLRSLAEAASLIPSGASLGLGGLHAHNGTMALIRELIRRDTKDLTLIPNVSVGLPAELLIAAGAVARVYASYVGLEHHGLAPSFRAAGQDGSIEVRDVDEPFSVYAMRAGAASLPFMPYPAGHDAVDVVRLNSDDFRRTTDPFTGEEVIVVRPLNPDFGLIHVPQADPFGNVRIEGSAVQDILIAKSSSHVIATAEEIIPVEETRTNPKRTAIPGFFVDTVVHVPFGAHPTSCHSRYAADEAHIEGYKRLGPEKYLTKYIREPQTHLEYLDLIGVGRLVSLLEEMTNHVA
jgi:glutaconate CoA-transferase subunit A